MLHHVGASFRRAAGRQQIVADEDALAGLDGVLMDFQRVVAVDSLGVSPDPMNKISNIFQLGGESNLLLTQPDPQGDYVLVHALVSQRILQQLKQQEEYNMVLGGGDWKLTSGEVRPPPATPRGGHGPPRRPAQHGGHAGLASALAYALLPCLRCRLRSEAEL